MIKQLKAMTTAGAVALSIAVSPPALAQSFLPSSSSEVGHYIWTPSMLQTIDKNRDGMVTRIEFLDYMGAQFDIMDTKKKGMLTRTEFMDKNMMARTFIPQAISNTPGE